MGKKSRFGSGMNIPNYIFERLEQFFRVKIIKFLIRIRIFLILNPESGKEKIRIRDKHPGYPPPCPLPLPLASHTLHLTPVQNTAKMAHK
jgi:hypothetical protein